MTSSTDARNITWAHLSRCFSFDPKDLLTYRIQDDWFVTAPVDARQQFGIWRINVFNGTATPHDPRAEQWQTLLDSTCDSPLRSTLVLPTFTPQPPIPTPVLRSPAEAVSVLWGYLVKCFPTLRIGDLESQFDPSSNEYIVKDKDVATFYGVWRIKRGDGRIKTDNDRARALQLILQTASC